MFENEIISSNPETIKKHRKCRFTGTNIEYLDPIYTQNDGFSAAKALKCIKILITTYNSVNILIYKEKV